MPGNPRRGQSEKTDPPRPWKEGTRPCFPQEQFLQFAACRGFRLAQRRQFMRRDSLQARRLGLVQGRIGDKLEVGFGFRFCSGDLRIGLAEIDQREQRFMALDVRGEIAIARRLARLALQARRSAGSICLSTSSRRARLASAAFSRSSASCRRGAARRCRRPPRECGGAACGLALMISPICPCRTSRRRARAGRGIGEQELHVAGAHLAAVDAVGRAGLALDPPRDLELIAVVESGRRLRVGVVERRSRLPPCCARAGRRCRRRSRRPCRRRACSCASSRPSPSAALRAGWTCRSRSARRRRSGPARSGSRSARRRS